MNCALWRGMLDAYVDDQSAPQDLPALEEHLRTCHACAAEALARLQIKRATRAAAAQRFAPSPAFRLRVEASLGESLQPKRKPFWSSLAGPGWGAPTLGAAVVALLLLVVSVVGWNRHTARELALAQLVDQHVATLASANPVDVVSTDRHTVKPWFQGKLPFTFNLPELQNSPYKLLGGKLVYFHNAPGAQLLFELRKHQFSVFILQDSSSGLSLPTGTSHPNGFSVESWNAVGLHYVVLGDTGPTEVHDLSELLKTAARL